MNVDSREVDLIGLDVSRLDNLLDLSNGDLGCCGHGWVEVSGCVSEDEVSSGVGLVGFDEGVVTSDGGFQGKLSSVEGADFAGVALDSNGFVSVVLDGESSFLLNINY